MGTLGIGLKTFICNKDSSIEKIAEFNKLSNTLRSKKSKQDLALFLAQCRNERIRVANKNYGITDSLYHIVARRKNELIFFEADYEEISISNIRDIEETEKTLRFNDVNNEYCFNFSKSVLQRKFYIPQNCPKIKIDIIDNPFEVLLLIKNQAFYSNMLKANTASADYIILPLFSLKSNKHVPIKSQLNQWNAGGRQRSLDEVYIPVPSIIYKIFPNFFPSRDIPFKLKTPLNEILSAKICQDNGKALMTNPNSALSKWILRKILGMKIGELLTLEKLEKVGFDSVIITKEKTEYFIDIMPLGSYEKFLEQNEFQ